MQRRGGKAKAAQELACALHVRAENAGELHLAIAEAGNLAERAFEVALQEVADRIELEADPARLAAGCRGRSQRRCGSESSEDVAPVDRRAAETAMHGYFGASRTIP
ncbi:hypothetical protein [Bradyrhizobium sp. Ec3.3]|uniref:hypothetical protein n=1 Tax=Bradyrhizobium sp. Ec3.3 TaxID=189753 RepID=UPI00048A36F2|nr:hypothetical protein [Bradyrhizobium sp. Ec3.3]